MPAAKVAQRPPDLAMLSQMAQAGPITVEITRFAGPSEPYAHIHRAEGLKPEEVLQLQPWLYDFSGGGRYRFRASTDNPGVQPFEWEQHLPGTPRPPAPIAMADAQARAGNGAIYPAAGYPAGATMQLPPGYSSYAAQGQQGPPGHPQQPYWGPPGWQQQQPMVVMHPSMMGWGGAPGGWQPQAQAQNSEVVELRRLFEQSQRALDQERHQHEMDKRDQTQREEREAMRRELDALKKDNAEGETTRLLRDLATKMSEAQHGGGQASAMATMVTSALQSITESSKAAIEASKSKPESPYVELLTKHIIEQGSSRSLGDMAKVSSEVMANAMGMMSEVAQMAQAGADESKTRNMMMKVFEQLGGLSKQIIPMLAGGRGPQQVQQAQAPQQVTQPPAPTAPQLPAAPEVPALPAPVLNSELRLGTLQPWIDHLRGTIAQGSISPELAAGSVADLLWRYYAWGQADQTGDLIPALVREPKETARKLLGYPPDDWFQAFLREIRPAAERVGFTTEIILGFVQRARRPPPPPLPLQENHVAEAAPSAADRA